MFRDNLGRTNDMHTLEYATFRYDTVEVENGLYFKSSQCPRISTNESFSKFCSLLDDLGHEVDMTDSRLQQTLQKIEKVLRLSDGKFLSFGLVWNTKSWEQERRQS